MSEYGKSEFENGQRENEVHESKGVLMILILMVVTHLRWCLSGIFWIPRCMCVLLRHFKIVAGIIGALVQVNGVCGVLRQIKNMVEVLNRVAVCFINEQQRSVNRNQVYQV